MRYFIVAMAVALASIADGAILRVAKDGDGVVVYNNIQIAINNGASGDTVLISGNMGPWSINDNLTIDRMLILIGQGNGCGGIPATRIEVRGIILTAAATGTVIEGIDFWDTDGKLGVDCYGSQITFKRCFLRGPCTDYTDTVVEMRASASCNIENCLILGCGYCIDHGGSVTQLTINNSIIASFAGTHTGVRSSNETNSIWISNSILIDTNVPITSSGNWYLDHNVFWDNGSWNGTVAGSVTASYNAVDNAAYSNFPGTNKINLNGVNPFIGYGGGLGACTDNLHPHSTTGSVLIDGGDPNAPNDRDGSRRDLGIYGGPKPYEDTGAPDYPFVTNFFISGSVSQNGAIEIRSTGRVGSGN